MGQRRHRPPERQQIQRWTSQLIPPELVGSHVGAPRAHTTGRTHDLPFRAGTALFGSFGIEWNLATASDLERKDLASWVALYKEVRRAGAHRRGGAGSAARSLLRVHGVIAHDRSEALFALVQLTPETSVPGAVRLPGLTPPAATTCGCSRPATFPTTRGDHPAAVDRRGRDVARLRARAHRAARTRPVPGATAASGFGPQSPRSVRAVRRRSGRRLG